MTAEATNENLFDDSVDSAVRDQSPAASLLTVVGAARGGPQQQ
jgi:hypothetical protein